MLQIYQHNIDRNNIELKQLIPRKISTIDRKRKQIKEKKEKKESLKRFFKNKPTNVKARTTFSGNGKLVVKSINFINMADSGQRGKDTSKPSDWVQRTQTIWTRV